MKKAKMMEPWITIRKEIIIKMYELQNILA
jgi:hypothetical protein